MNELQQLARLRAEVPAQSSHAAQDAILAEILRPGLREPASGMPAGRKSRFRGPRPVRRWGLRPVIAGSVALAVGAGTAIGITVTRSPHQGPATSQVIAWSGKPTADWPAGQPSYGPASTEAQLIDYATRAAAADRPPKPNEWVVMKEETADSSAGSGGLLFGPPDERKLVLGWWGLNGCAGASLVFPANLAPTNTVTGKLKVSLDPQYVYAGERNCLPALHGWKSVTYSYLDSLPTDPAALEKIILTDNRPGGLIPTKADAVFDAIETLLSGETEGVVVPRKLEATLYRILQRLPGVHFDRATDLAGRSGLGFWMVREGYLKDEIVISPVTYDYMGSKSVALKNHTETETDGTRHIKAGQVTEWVALLGTAIVQHPGQLP
jgi:hypothetical protein